MGWMLMGVGINNLAFQTKSSTSPPSSTTYPHPPQPIHNLSTIHPQPHDHQIYEATAGGPTFSKTKKIQKKTIPASSKTLPNVPEARRRKALSNLPRMVTVRTAIG